MGYDGSAVQNPVRLRVLHDALLLDTPPEENFDRLTKLAARVLRVPMAFVSLVDAERQFFKSCIGLEVRETTLEASFCQHVVALDEPLIIPDARAHPLVQHMAVVRNKVVGAYLGVPLRTCDGFVLGSFCAADSVPRQWTAEDVETMVALAEAVMTELALRQDIADRQLAERQRQAFSALGQQLSLATTAEEAAHIIARVSNDLLGWDAYALSLYSPFDSLVHNVLVMDTINGVLTQLHLPPSPPTSMTSQTMAKGPQLILRTEEELAPANFVSFGDKDRPSASLLFVPIHSGMRRIGVLTIQSYRPQAYTHDDLATLLALADHCGGALERTQAEAALRESEERFRRLSEAASEGIAFSENGVLFDANSACARLYGYTPHELIGLPAAAFAAPESVDLIQRMNGANDETLYEAVCRRKDGTTFLAELQGRRVPYQGRTVRVTIVRDITERKRAEQALREFAAKLEQSNRELQDFAFVASHDLQEPLRKVQAFGDRLERKYGPLLGAEGRDYLIRMQSAAQRMSILITDLLQFSRVTTQAQPFVSVDLAVVVGEVLEDLALRIEQTGARITLGPLPTIVADPRQMQQLFQNLLENALKFHQPGQAPVIDVWCERGEAAVAAPYWQIMVKDHGIGFDPKYLERIFVVFQRLHGRDEYEGTGVGLALCRKIAERHEGSITARSTPGQGATFIVTLPIPQKEFFSANSASN